MDDLQQAFEDSLEQLEAVYGKREARNVLEAAADAHYGSDCHKWREADAVREAYEAARNYNPEAELFEVEFEALHYKYATDHYYVVGVDEADAVRRFHEALKATVGSDLD